MEQNKIVLNEDQRVVLLKALKDIHFANSQLHEWVTKGELTEEMSKTLPSLIESYFSEAAKILNYESHLLTEKEKRHEDIRKANQTIRELEGKLGSSKPIDGLAEQLKHLSDVVNKWWGEEGFNHVGDEVFTPYGGFKARFSFMLDHRFSYSNTPVTDKRNQEEHIQYLRDMGFEFNDLARGRSEKLYLIDNPKNRLLLLKMLEERFPSLEVHSWKNWKDRDQEGVYYIRDFEATIYELTDI